MNTYEAKPSVSLLEELCGYQPQLADNDTGSITMPTHQTVPPTGLSDTGLADTGLADTGIADIDCWVARAVYGVENSRWMLFREWLRGDAPAWFRNLYIRRGARFAQWLAPHHGIKSVIRRWMDFIIDRRGA